MPKVAQDSGSIIPDSAGTRRLHITPLTEELLPRILGSHLALVQNVSFHKIPSSPHRDYGFVTLPIAEAAMVKKRLHGTILRGEKVAVEDARPDVRKETAAAEREKAGEAVPTSEPPVRTLRKRRREEGVISGAVELPQGRHIKRGWTESKTDMENRKIKEKKSNKSMENEKKSTKARVKPSSFTDKEECLFQTTLPENSAQDDKEMSNSQDRKKSKKGKNAVVVHEFKNTTKYPSYLRYSADKDKKAVQEYDESKGWVDQDGNVVEPVTESSSKRKSSRIAKQDNKEPAEETLAEAPPDEDETSSSGSSSEDEELSESAIEPGPANIEMDTDVKGLTRPVEPEVSITPSSPVTPHPLETLFKKPKPPSGQQPGKANLEIDTSFSFFGADEGEQDTAQPRIAKSLETPGIPAIKRRGLPSLSIPVTPYSQHDMRFRGQRSAAPTPDTAAPGKSGFGDPFGLLAGTYKDREKAIEEEEEGDVDEGGDEDIMQGVEESEQTSLMPPVPSSNKGGDKESDFSKWFWENRGANTRAWKKRKREASKEQKNRESRKRKA